MAKLAVITLQRQNHPPQAADPGARAAAALEAAGHAVARENLRADMLRLKGLLIAALADPRFDGLLLVGDISLAEQETISFLVDQIAERRLLGFADMARQVLFAQEGPSLVLSWFSAGSHSGRLLLALPGGCGRLDSLLESLVVPQLKELLEWARS
jgi:molybdopterin biosynthesis enzyme MoaB